MSRPSLTIDLRAFGGTLVPAGAWTLTDDDLRATNTEQQPDRVGLTELAGVRVDGSRVTATLPRVSWSAITLRPE